MLRRVFWMIILVTSLCRSDVLLHPDDEITIRSLQIKELADKPYRIDAQGGVKLPLIGRVDMAGLSVTAAESLLLRKLSAFYVSPDLEITITGPHAETASVLGSVANAGVQRLRPGMTLIDVLSAAGGLRADAGPVLVLTRVPSQGPIPAEKVRLAADGASSVEIDLKALLDVKDPRANLIVMPSDIISIAAGQLVYVVGNVKRSGGFTLSGRNDLSVLQALALAEGLDIRAAPSHARILRRHAEKQEQIAVNLKRILAGKAEDLRLLPNDVLFVPSSAQKTITTRSIEAAIQIGTGLLIFR